MPVPTYDVLMLPVLRHSAEHDWKMQDLISQIATELKLTDAELTETIPSGDTSLIASRTHWAKTYLKQAGLLDQPSRAVIRITERGRSVLDGNTEKIDATFLTRFPEFVAFTHRHKSNGDGASRGLAPSAELSETPDEQITTASAALTEALRDALLARVLETSPAFFEKLIIDLLLAMGYGGSQADAADQLGKTGDGGVDGVIREDQLGLDRVYLQAKRYAPGNVVGSEVVQAFIGALIGKGAQKGVLITTSAFSKPALNVASQAGSLRLVLIDGQQLTNLMIRFNVGVRIARNIEIKSLTRN